MSRFGVIALLLMLLAPRLAPAQVIECPGTLPSVNLTPAQVTEVAHRLLGRFMAALDLHGLTAIDQRAIHHAYRAYPEQLLIKLSYLALQCHMVILDAKLAADDRRRAVRRVFLNYVLSPPKAAMSSLAAYVNDVATSGHAEEAAPSIEAAIERIETALEQARRRQWQQRWFLDRPEVSTAENGPLARPWSVIVASPRYEDEGWQALQEHQARWPDVYFELDGPFDLDKPHYAVVAGRGLGTGTASQLLDKIKTMGMPADSFTWRAPARIAPSGDSDNAAAPVVEVIRPSPSRPATSVDDADRAPD